ncbi:HDOD domain-containing protein [Sideroxydans lithotrophicus]|uniref:Putative signal transduction protein n=1 Tax=Sideroxydans lithotrophicus (strain ES-1) TaxID=580332 RepID=D5CS58_SIDLE|nr:HDOD domain-containing protein [Sideroxydans lithotrophicus]ADE11794.1 putative signal transduction protein [Sideroxydans lithotrophicus ES-1]
MHGNAVNAEKILGSIQLPACPAIMLDIMSEARKEEPDFNHISRLVGNDAGLSAAVLKLANSPAFRRNSNISSIPQAVSVLGLKKVMLAVNTLFLRNSVSMKDPAAKAFLEKFWDKSSCTAEAASMLAKTLPGISIEDAYTIGLFHDSGIPVLMQRFPEHSFDETLHESDWENTHREEESRLGTNHAVVGNMLARNWGLPAHVCQTILNHHDMSIFTDLSHQISTAVRNFIAVLILAEHMASVFMGLEKESALGQLPTHAHALNHIGMEPAEFHEAALDILGEMRQYRH